MRMGERPTDHYDDLLDIVFAALTRAHPQLDRDAFEGWPIPTFELIEAVPTIAKQTGFLRSGEGEGSANPPDWDGIIAQFCNFLPGTTPDYWEDALTACRLEAMYAEWRLRPPPAVLLAGYLGYRPKPRALGAVEELVRLFPAGKLQLN